MGTFMRIRTRNPNCMIHPYRLSLDVHFPMMLSRIRIFALSSLREKRLAFSLLALAHGGYLLPSQPLQLSLQILIHHLLIIDT
jgi:hypothetical protein